MRWALLLSLVASVALGDDHPGRFRRFCARTDQGRTERGFACDNYALFEAFPASGAGTTGPCAASNPTTATGQAFTFARASVGTCSPLGRAMTGITNASLVELSNNIARQEADGDGVLGLHVEQAGTDLLLRFIDYANAAWADVGTPTLTGSQVSPFTGTYANLAVQFDDNDGGAFEGRSQTVTVSAGSAYFAHCYVKAGTATSARIALDGTAATITGLSSSTWSIIEVGDASASAAAVAFEVDVGSIAATTGTVIFGGCQVELGTYRTTIIPTTATTATRATEMSPTVTLAAALASTGCLGFAATPQVTGGLAGAVGNAGNARPIYSVGANILFFDGTNNPSTPSGAVANVAKRYRVTWSTANGVVLRNVTDANQAVSAFTVGTWAPDTSLELMFGTGAAVAVDGIISRVIYDPSESRCP